MTVADRPDNGQDEGQDEGRERLARVMQRADRESLPIGRYRTMADAALASASAGAGEQQRDEPLHEAECPSCGATIRARMADAPQPDEQPEPCPVYSHDTDGWHCAVTGDHDQHTNAAGDETW